MIQKHVSQEHVCLTDCLHESEMDPASHERPDNAASSPKEQII